MKKSKSVTGKFRPGDIVNVRATVTDERTFDPDKVYIRFDSYYASFHVLISDLKMEIPKFEEGETIWVEPFAGALEKATFLARNGDHVWARLAGGQYQTFNVHRCRRDFDDSKPIAKAEPDVAPPDDETPIPFKPAQHVAPARSGSVVNDRDTMGRPWAKMSKLKAGDKVETDGDFPCMPSGATLTVEADEKGHLFIPCCGERDHGDGEADERHYLDGQADDGEHLVGLYHVGP